jgi:hypothetical protein
VENSGVLTKKKIMNRLKRQIKNFNTIPCILAAILLGIAGCATPNSGAGGHNPESVWNDMKSCLEAGDISGAISGFSIASKDRYQREFSSLSKAELLSYAKGLGPIKPASIESDRAQYYFESVVDGQKITFPIEFDKENGEWKILEF